MSTITWTASQQGKQAAAAKNTTVRLFADVQPHSQVGGLQLRLLPGLPLLTYPEPTNTMIRQQWYIYKLMYKKQC